MKKELKGYASKEKDGIKLCLQPERFQTHKNGKKA